MIHFKKCKILFLLFISLHFAEAAKAQCDGCEPLRKVEAQFKAYRGNKPQSWDVLQLRATEAIQKLPLKKGKLTPEQAARVIALFQLSIPKDPANAIVDNNYQLVKNNYDLLVRQTQRLPLEDENQIKSAMAVVMATAENGNGDPVKRPAK